MASPASAAARSAAWTQAAVAGARLTSGCPASCSSTAGLRSHSPRHGLRTQHASLPSPSWPSSSVSRAAISSPPAPSMTAPQATSSHTCATYGARGSVANIA